MSEIGAECICWRSGKQPRYAGQAVCPRHRPDENVPSPWELCRLAAGYFQAIEEQLRPHLEHPDNAPLKGSALYTAAETAANIALHQRTNLEREGVEAARVMVSVLPSDMRGENALAWLASPTTTERESDG